MWFWFASIFLCPTLGPKCWAGGLLFAAGLYTWYLLCPWDIPGSCARWTWHQVKMFAIRLAEWWETILGMID